MASRPGDPTESTVKKLMVLSGNRCAFQNIDSGTCCENELARPEWERVRAVLAHICGEKPTAPRYDASLTPEQRGAYENIIVLCPTHAEHIDYIEPKKYTSDVLLEMKRQHEERLVGASWTTVDALTSYARLILVHQFGIVVTDEGGALRDSARGADEIAATQVQEPSLDAEFIAGPDSVDASPDVARGTGAAFDATQPSAQAIHLKSLQADVDIGKVTIVEGSRAVETDRSIPGKLLLENGGELLTETGDPILLERDGPG